MKRREWMIALLLAAITLALYWPARHFDLVYFDDPIALQDSPEIKAGLTWDSVRWALGQVVLANWIPATQISFLAVSQFCGTAPGPHHLANAILHAANAALLFLLLFRLTGSTWRSAVAAALFAWHPLRVESVAWITERKDVLCSFFFLLSLLAYAGYAKGRNSEAGMQKPSTKAGFWRSSAWWLALAFYALALLSKPMAVTLPILLFLLDCWPLRRIPNPEFRIPNLKWLALEKWPFLLLTFLFCAATYRIQHDHSAMTSWETLGLDRRLANAVDGCVAYLGQTVWPAGMAAIYPYPKAVDWWQTGTKLALLLAITAACFQQIRRRPQLAFGWLWYLIMVLPVIGIVQVGEQSRADRYTYLPLIGPVVAVVWSVAELAGQRRRRKNLLAAAALAVLAGLCALTARQLGYWQDTVTLFAHNVEVTPDNASAHFTLGLGYEHAGDTNRALVCYRVAQRLSPAQRDPQRNLAGLLLKSGFTAAAEKEYQDMAVRRPDDPLPHQCLAGIYAGAGNDAQAVAELEEMLRCDAKAIDALNNLAWMLATSPDAAVRDGPYAVALAQRACELTANAKAQMVGTLGAAYAEAGNFGQAAAAARSACDLAAKNGETNLLERNRQLLELYLAHQPYHEKMVFH